MLSHAHPSQHPLWYRWPVILVAIICRVELPLIQRYKVGAGVV